VNDFAHVPESEYAFELLGVTPLHAAHIARRIGNQPHGERHPRFVLDLDTRPHAELADHGDDPRWQQAGVTFEDGMLRTVIDAHRTARAAAHGDPAFAGTARASPGHEECPDLLAIDDALQHAWQVSTGDDGRDTVLARQASGRHLCQHASDTGLAAMRADVRIDLCFHLDRRDDTALSTVGQNTIDTTEHHQQLRRCHTGHQGCEVIVVPHLDFIVGQRIVLVDDGDDPTLQQVLQGVACAQEPTSAFDVFG